jgi:hypothetical protein
MGEAVGLSPTSSRSIAASSLSILVGLALAVLSLPADAGSVEQATVVSPDPADFTPNVVADDKVGAPAVYAMAQSKGVMYAGGHFRTVENAAGTRAFDRRNVVAFNAENGKIKKFAPRTNGSVSAVQPYKKALFLGGAFSAVDGVKRQAIVKVNRETGKVVKKFKSPFASGEVTDLHMAKGRLVVGGSIPGALKALNPSTGKVTEYLKLRIKGSVADNAGPTRVSQFTTNGDRKRLVAVGNFTSVQGKKRVRAFMVRLGSNKGTVTPWAYKPFRRSCSAADTPSYLKDVDFAPDGSYFVVVATGFVAPEGAIGTAVCDAAARFETHVKHPSQPTWVNYTGGDSLYSTVVTGAAVYVQGHQRWLDNPEGVNEPGPGAVERKGIGAINPDTGKALGWNPGKSRAVGGRSLVATKAGLWVGSDGTEFAGEFRGRIAFCPL